MTSNENLVRDDVYPEPRETDDVQQEAYDTQCTDQPLLGLPQVESIQEPNTHVKCSSQSQVTENPDTGDVANRPAKLKMTQPKGRGDRVKAGGYNDE